MSVCNEKFFEAIKSNNIEEAKKQIAAGADVNIPGKYNSFSISALEIAETAEMTKLLIDAGANVNVRDECGGTPLHYANTAEQTKLLIEAGADVNAMHGEGYTPLHCAKTIEQAKLLVEAGADVNDDTGGRGNALCNVHHNYSFYKQKYGISQEEALKMTQYFIELGADVNSQCMGWTPLHEVKTVEEAKLLVAAGANVNAFTAGWDKISPLQNAETTEIVKFLVEAGAEINTKDAGGRTAVHYLVGGRSGGMVMDSYGNSGPRWTRDALEDTKILLEAGANINVKDKEGRTPLYYADAPQVAELLIKAGAEVTPDAEKQFIEKASKNAEWQEVLSAVQVQKGMNKTQIIAKIAQVKERLLANKGTYKNNVSGVVIADKIAEGIRSGTIDKTVTPEVGNKLAADMKIIHCTNKKNSER